MLTLFAKNSNSNTLLLNSFLVVLLLFFSLEQVILIDGPRHFVWLGFYCTLCKEQVDALGMHVQLFEPSDTVLFLFFPDLNSWLFCIELLVTVPLTTVGDSSFNWTYMMALFLFDSHEEAGMIIVRLAGWMDSQLASELAEFPHVAKS